MVTTVREDVQELDAAAFVSSVEPRRLRPAYGFDDVAIVPGVETLHPDDVDLSWSLGCMPPCRKMCRSSGSRSSPARTMPSSLV